MYNSHEYHRSLYYLNKNLSQTLEIIILLTHHFLLIFRLKFNEHASVVCGKASMQITV